MRNVLPRTQATSNATVGPRQILDSVAEGLKGALRDLCELTIVRRKALC